MVYYTCFTTACCEVILAGTGDAVTSLQLNSGEGRGALFHIPDDWQENNDVLASAAKQVVEYFDGVRKDFAIKVAPTGTDFQKKVWQELTVIPYGEVRSYKDIAIAVGNEKASRAVGMANNKNPIPIIIPCHRVIGSDGSLVGFARGLDFKRRLLVHENEGFSQLK